MSINEGVREFCSALAAGGASVRGNIHEELGQPNQDAYLIDEHNRLFAIFDGHGDHGHVVAADIKHRLSEQFVSSLKRSPSIEDAFRHSFAVLDKHVCAQNTSSSSGSTATIAYVSDDTLYLAAVGDCAAYLVHRRSNTDDLDIKSLFALHKLHNECESKRIQASGGVISGEYVVHPKDDLKMINITRAFGDQDLKGSGIISVPEISATSIRLDDVIGGVDDDVFLVMSSDGLDCIPQDKMVRSVHSMLRECGSHDMNDMCGKLLDSLEKTVFNGCSYFSDDTTLVVVNLSRGRGGGQSG